MLRIGSVFLFIVVICTSCYRPSPRESFEDLKILQGKWRTIEGPDFIELWELKNENLLSGLGLSLDGEDTVFSESLQIYLKDEEVFYAALVEENENYVPFRLENALKDHWQFVNPDHDYPNIIEYTLLDDSTLQACTMNLRRKKELKFIMRKVQR